MLRNAAIVMHCKCSVLDFDVGLRSATVARSEIRLGDLALTAGTHVFQVRVLPIELCVSVHVYGCRVDRVRPVQCTALILPALPMVR